MNNKNCKRLRRFAQRIATGVQNVEYQPQHWQQNGAMSPRRLTATCTRAVYQRIKRNAAMAAR